MKDNVENSNDELSNELLEKLKTNKEYNPDLGTPKDPRYAIYKEFVKQIDNAVIKVIKSP